MEDLDLALLISLIHGLTQTKYVYVIVIRTIQRFIVIICLQSNDWLLSWSMAL